MQSDDGMDCAEAFCPGPAEEFHEDGFGLVVEGVGGEDAVDVARGQESGEEFVACVAGGLFDGFGIAMGAGFDDTCGNVGLVQVEGDIEADAEVFDELLVSVGFFAAKVVVDVDCGKAYAEGLASGGVGCEKSEEKSDGVGAAGDGDADAVSGFDVGAVEGEGGHPLHSSCSFMRRTWVEFYIRPKFGKPLHERNGFEATNQMILRLDGAERPG